MKIDVLVAEIGSTTTNVNAFAGIHTENPEFLGQGQALTTVLEGDVNIGLHNAIEDLKKTLDADIIVYEEMFATSSAAGGLKMTVHGLVYDMTVKAAKEAALGAGANIHLVTAGKLKQSDLKKIRNVHPNIILLSGGVDYGERDTALYNAELLADADLHVPVLYAGNIENHEDIQALFEKKHQQEFLHVVENVYPKIDVLNVEPARTVIQNVFEKHIVHAPGMTRVRELVNGPIIPTPGAVMDASKLLRDAIGDLVTLDVGGATTDVHSVTEGSEEVNRILLSPEPLAKRTVEGDLGVFVNMSNIVARVGEKRLIEELDIDEKLINNHQPIPGSKEEIKFVERLALEVVVTSVHRHVGRYRSIYGNNGKKTVAEGKDLTSLKWIIGTGGALTRLPDGTSIIKQIALSNKGDKLLPSAEAQILIDTDYTMASLGVLSRRYKSAALKMLKESLCVG